MLGSGRGWLLLGGGAVREFDRTVFMTRMASWKRCPLCFDPVYKFDLKNVIIRKNTYYKEGDTIKMNLQVRSKANILVKDKLLES